MRGSQPCTATIQPNVWQLQWDDRTPLIMMGPCACFRLLSEALHHRLLSCPAKGCCVVMPVADAWDDAPERGRTRSWHPPQVVLSCSMCKNRPVAGPSSNKEEACSTMALTVPASWGASSPSRPIRYGLISLRFHKSHWVAVVAQRPEVRRENRPCHACSGILIYRHSIQRSWAVASLRLLRVAPNRSQPTRRCEHATHLCSLPA